MMDYKVKLMQILGCFFDCEGSIFEDDWDRYGVTEKEKEIILAEFDKFAE